MKRRRKRKPKRKPKLVVNLPVRVSPEEKAMYDRCARFAGLTLADWVRMKLAGKRITPKEPPVVATLAPKKVLPRHKITPIPGDIGLADQIQGLGADDGMIIEISGIDGSWTLENNREVTAFCEGLEVGSRNQEHFEAALSAIEAVLMKAQANGATRTSVLSDAETINGYLAGCGPLNERVAAVIGGIVGFLG